MADDFSFTPTTMTATAAPGSLFMGWTVEAGGCTGSLTPCQLPLTTVFSNYSLTASFIRVPDNPPVATTGATSPGPAGHMVKLEGTVDPSGFAVTDCRFEYGATTAYGRTSNCDQEPSSLGSGNAAVPVTASTDPLEPNTTYHYRLTASNEVAPGSGSADEGDDHTFTTGSASSDDCPNADIRASQGIAALLLPDCMALEQASPQRKDNQWAKIYYSQTVTGASPVGAFSVDGDRLTFRSQGTLGGSEAYNAYDGDVYVAARDAGQQGWETFSTSPPAPLIRGWIAVPLPQGISADLSHWFSIASTVEDYESGLGQAFRGGLGGELEPFSPFLASPNWTPEHGTVVFESRGAAADGSRLYFTADLTITYLPGDPSPAGTDAVENTYIAELDSGGDPSLGLLARDGLGKAWGGNCGASVGGGRTIQASSRERGAISVDGSRTYFTTRPDQPATGDCDSATHKKRIMVREETAGGVEIGELFPSPSGVGDDAYEGASIDGSKVLLTTVRPLVASDVDGATDLYLYDADRPADERLVNLSGAGTATPSVATFSGDGSRVYFNSDDVLTADAGPGTGTAQAGQNNLYLYDTEAGELSFIAITDAGSAYPVPVLGPDPEALGVGGDGHLLFFTSPAALTADDTDGSATDIFRYDALDDTLVRISKAAGGSDNGAADVLTGSLLGDINLNSPHFATFARWVSEDGETVGFKTFDGLVAGDDNGIMDSYAWHEGELFRLPGTADSLGWHAQKGLQDRPIVSPDGDSVGFQTYQQLLAGDGDGAVDIYVARVGGGFPKPPDADASCDTLAGDCQGDGAPPTGAARETGDAGDGNTLPGVRARLAVRAPGREARRRAAHAGVIRLRVRVSRPGNVRAVAKARMRTSKGPVTRQVATRRTRFAKAGTRVLELTLNPAALRRLAHGELLRVEVAVKTAGARARTVTVPLKRGNNS